MSFPFTSRIMLLGRASLYGAMLLALAPNVRTLHAQEGHARFIRPSTRGYSQAAVSPDGRTLYISGQVAVDSTGQIVGVGDFRAQATQVYENLERILTSVGATFSDVLKMTTYLTDIRDFPVLREVRTDYLNLDGPPASTVVAVAALGGPRLMLEIEAIAVLPRPYRQ